MKRFVTLFIVFTAMAVSSACAQQINEMLMRKVQSAEFFISHFYVDSLSEDKVVDDAIVGMLKQLDPHSTYIKAKDVERSTENLNGSFEGIGVQFNIIDDTLVVIQPVSGGPSEKKGIIAGDRIVTVNDTAIAGVKMAREEMIRRLRGPKGSKVSLGIVRQGVKGVNRFVVVRDKIPVHTLDASYMMDARTGYIRLSSFGQTTHQEFLDAAHRLFEQGMVDLVLDLQGNGGGYLSAAVDISNEFLEQGDLIVYTDGRSIRRQEFRADGNGSFRTGRVMVLVDSYTASAAEIVSGAIQDNDRGVIIGRRTFGKGLVQRPFELPDKSVIRLTTSHYYSPSGRCIQKPYKLGQRKDYDDDINERLKSGELQAQLKGLIDHFSQSTAAPDSSAFDSIQLKLASQLFPDSLRFRTLRTHRSVYAGGGIMPDVYVPLDTARYTPLYRQLSAKSCILNASLKYMDKNRKRLTARYKQFVQFRDEFAVPQELIDMLRHEADVAHVEYTDSTWQAALPDAAAQLKGLLARDLWDMSEYYQMINPTTDIYQEALRQIVE